MTNLETLIQEFENNKIKKVSIFISEMFDGAYQLKEGYEKPENDYIIELEDPDEINEYDMHFGHEYKKNKPFFGPFFYIAVEQELDVNWFIGKIKEYIENEGDTLDYFIDFLVNEYNIHVTSEIGLIGGDVKEVSRSETLILTDGNIGLNGERKKYQSDIDFAVSTEAIELDYLFFINEKPLIFSDLDNNIDSITNDKCENQIQQNYYDNGKLKAEYETRDGEVHGYYKLYHENGQLRVTIHFENGHQVDEVIDSFDLNGKLVRKTEIKNGVLNGPFKEYYPSGKIKRAGEYKDGEIFGVPKEYLENGEILKSYKNIKEINIPQINSGNRFGIRRVEDQVVDLDGNYYQQVVYGLILICEMEEDDQLDGDWLCDLFYFMFSNESKSFVNIDNIEIDDIEPRDDENFPYNELESIYKRDIENYGIELKRIVDIEKIKSFAINFIENYEV